MLYNSLFNCTNEDDTINGINIYRLQKNYHACLKHTSYFPTCKPHCPLHSVTRQICWLFTSTLLMDQTETFIFCKVHTHQSCLQEWKMYQSHRPVLKDRRACTAPCVKQKTVFTSSLQLKFTFYLMPVKEGIDNMVINTVMN